MEILFLVSILSSAVVWKIHAFTNPLTNCNDVHTTSRQRIGGPPTSSTAVRSVIRPVRYHPTTTRTTTTMTGSSLVGNSLFRLHSQCRHQRHVLYSSSFPSFGFDSNEGENDDDDDDDDDYIDTESLGDWRTFRRSLAMDGTTSLSSDSGGDIGGMGNTKTTTTKKQQQQQQTRKGGTIRSVSKDNEEVLFSQNKQLAEEYMNGVWAHETSTPEVGGLVVRMPLEVELYRNYRHSLMGRRLKEILTKERSVRNSDGSTVPLDIGIWYARAKKMVEQEMGKIANMADDQGQIDATKLKEEASEMLSLYLDNQETWQEVCLVVEKDDGDATTLVLNRPMAFQLTENLGRLVLFGAFQSERERNGAVGSSRQDLVRFMMAFRQECAVYVGGPDEQGNPATLIHGIADLPGAVEISPGSKIYRGGIEAAVNGVLDGKYSPLEFRFFVGCHSYEESSLEVAVHLGKYQPVACARAVALKQCISLPKPLWHEVAELCGGDLADLSSLELLKRDDLQFQVVDDTDFDEDDDDDIMIVDDLGEPYIDVDDDDDDDDDSESYYL